MFPLTLREAKGSPLTHQEMDNNLKHVMFPTFLHIQDQKLQGTNGGTFTSGAWRTRDLNTVLTNTITGASLAANQITLPAGKYYVEASAPAYSYGDTIISHQSRLYNTSTTSTLLIGTNERARGFTSGVDLSTRSHILGCFDISTESVVSVQHICGASLETWGFGIRGNFTTEVYSDIRIWRIGEYEE